MTLTNYFNVLEDEKAVYNEIRSTIMGTNEAINNLMFNYNFYTSVYKILNEQDFKQNVLDCIMYFVIKESSIANSLAIINNTFMITRMYDKDTVLRILSGQKSNIILIDNDAAKLGGLLALAAMILDTTKLDLFKETLFLTKNML